MRATSISFRRAVATHVAAAAALLMWGGGLIGAAAPGGGGPPAAVNPHWDSARCGECHGTAGDRPRSIGAGEADRICLRCHDGRAAAAEAHAVGRGVPKARPAPAGWPLVEGRLGCLTCHDVTRACAADAQRTDENAKLLRGADAQAGVDAGRAAFCRNCHAAEEFQRYNPHAMLTAGREVIAERCLACHAELPDRAVKVRTGRAVLRGGEVVVCRSCHGKHKDQFNPGHLGAKVKPDMLAYIRAREMVGLAAPPGAELLAQIKAAGAKPTLMVTAADGTVTCTTCHNPHQAGVFPPGTPLAYRPMRVVGGRAISPVRGDQWCNHCHDL